MKWRKHKQNINEIIEDIRCEINRIIENTYYYIKELECYQEYFGNIIVVLEHRQEQTLVKITYDRGSAIIERKSKAGVHWSEYISYVKKNKGPYNCKNESLSNYITLFAAIDSYV